MIRRMLLAAVLAAALSLAACGVKKEPFEYQSDNRAKQGRGVFTGDDGVWTIYRRSMPPPEPQAAPTAEEGQTQAEGAAADEEDPAAPKAPVPEE